ncbi:MAG TPA: tetratricopeptide repeat protein [Thermoanaerobaculia bacterium]|nr:tetratricopeptide repeat protein [Thermoanaerobaculia bacterium]
MARSCDAAGVPLGNSIFALLAEPADPAVCEAAFTAGRRLFEAQPPGIAARALVLPGIVLLRGQEMVPAPDPLLDELLDRPPELEPGFVHLTGHALRELEGPWESKAVQDWRRPSGRQVPLHRLVRPARDTRPWRNPELFHRATAFVDRPDAEELSTTLASPACLVTGPIGCGKTRAVAHTLRDEAGVLWARCWSDRSGGPSLSAQLLHALSLLVPWSRSYVVRWPRNPGAEDGDSTQVVSQLAAHAGAPLHVVIDDVEAAEDRDLELVRDLLASSALGRVFRLCAIGRPASRAETICARIPRVALSPLPELEAEGVWQQLAGGLSIPPGIDRRLLRAGGGLPFVQEEGLTELVRRRHLRQLYGNYFYSGPSDVDFLPTPRLVRHVESETRRLDSVLPLQIAAVCGQELAIDLIPTICERLGTVIVTGWERRAAAGGLLATTSDSTEAVLLAPGIAASLADGLGPETEAAVRGAVAGVVTRSATDAPLTWERYRLLARTPEAIPLLLQMAGSGGGHDPEQLFHAARDELEAHRNRGGDEASELSLLMLFLRLARQLGALKNLESAIERAIGLARDEPLRRLALTTLKAEHQQYAGHLREAETSLLEGLELARGVDPTRKSLILIQLGKLLQRQHRYAEARRLFEDLLTAVERVGNRPLTAACRYHLGNLFLHEGNLPRAFECHLRSLEERRSLGLDQHIGQSLTAVAAVHLAQGAFVKAIELYKTARDHLLAFGAPGEVSYALLGLARTYNRLGDPEAAAPLVRESLDLRSSLDDQIGAALAGLDMAETHLQLGQLDQALKEARRASFRLALLDQQRYFGDAEQLLGRIHLQLRQPSRAVTHLQQAFTSHRQCGHVRDATFDRAWLLEAALALDDSVAIERHCADLGRVLSTIRYPESGEVIDLRLFRGLRWLEARGRAVGDPLAPLRRAYQALLAKTEHLETAMRNRFLFRVPDNRAILDFAAELGAS